jgi:hypothetical protein
MKVVESSTAELKEGCGWRSSVKDFCWQV